MEVNICPECTSEEHVVPNSTNHAVEYYCTACRQPFDVPEWDCPKCEEDTAVAQNPFDDPCNYYCYQCDLAFNRLGATFDRVVMVCESEDEAPGTVPKDLAVHFSQTYSSCRGMFQYQVALENVGPEPIRTRGRQPIAIQYRVTEDGWWTIYGNPDDFRPTEEQILSPDQRFSWEVTFHPEGISGPAFEVGQKPLPSGTYRFLYWGFPDVEETPAVCLPVEFEYEW